MRRLTEILGYWKLFLLDANEKIHTREERNKKGKVETIITAESLVMNNFIVDWFTNFEEDIREYLALATKSKDERGER